jgi:signal peptidase I
MDNRAQELLRTPNLTRPAGAVATIASLQRSSFLAWLSGTVRFAVIFLLLVLLLKGSVFEAFYIPSSSMQPTLKKSDYMLVAKYTYGLRLPFLQDTVLPWSPPSRGEVVVFIHQAGESQGLLQPHKGNLVKRVIGIGGDTVEVRGAQVIVNGESLHEPYALWGLGGGQLSFGPVQVPEGSVFVMGDNRDDSQDSRFWQDPFVKVEHIQGRVLLVYWSSSNLGRSRTFIR